MDSLEWSIWSECKFKCLEKWFRSAMTIIYLANIAIGITSDDHSFLKARQLFNMVLVQLMLGGHVLGLLGHLVQEVPGLALDKDFHQHEFLSH